MALIHGRELEVQAVDNGMAIISLRTEVINELDVTFGSLGWWSFSQMLEHLNKTSNKLTSEINYLTK